MERRKFTPVTFAQAEERLLIDTLNHFEWDKRKAADALGCALKTIYNKLNHYGYSTTQ